MEKTISALVDWFETYLRNRDILLKKIENIEKGKDTLTVTFKDKTQHFYFFPTPEGMDFSILEKVENPVLVFLNTEQNLNFLFVHWAKLIEHVKLQVFFINPFSETDKRWILFPYTHHQISETTALETGLKSMFESVEPITVEEFNQKN